MPIALTEEHRALQEVARTFLEREGTRGQARSALERDDDTLPSFWPKLCSLGWLGLHLPASVGGSGYGLLELALLIEEMGHSLAPGPFLPTVMSSALLNSCGTEAQKSRLLPDLAQGRRLAAIGLSADLRFDSSGVVAGRARSVLGATLADVLLLPMTADFIVVARTAPGVTVVPAPNLDPTQRCAEVELAGVKRESIEVIPNSVDRALTLFRTLAAAQAAGGAAACVGMSAVYAQQREQFGRPIGTFQAVKHHCANMLIRSELAAAAAWDAARAMSGDQQEATLAGAIAAAYALPAFLHNAELNVQVHGGIGFTWEHDCHLFLRRAASLVALFQPLQAASQVVQLYCAGVDRRPTVELPAAAENVRRDARVMALRLRSLNPAAQRKELVDSGYVQPSWPKPWGLAAGLAEQLVIDEELAGIARPDYGITTWNLRTIIEFGTSNQLQRWVRPSLLGELVWCQLFSEPGAGSDAAGISTRAEKVADGWIVTGQKVWTTLAHESQMGLATVRTAPELPKHQGITVMAIDMKTRGVQVRPLKDALGRSRFNEVFLDGVFVPDADVLGEVNGGWTVARAILGFERQAIGQGIATDPAWDRALIQQLKQVALEQPERAATVGPILVDSHALYLFTLKLMQLAIEGRKPVVEGAIGKVARAENVQRAADLLLELIGPAATLANRNQEIVGLAVLLTRQASIGGGTSEIARNQIAERILKLPRDPLII